MKIITRCGDDAVAGLNEALLRPARLAAAKLLRTDRVRADTTVVAAYVGYPTDSGLLAKAIGSMARTVERIKAGARRTGPVVGGVGGAASLLDRRQAVADNSIVTRPRPRCSVSSVNWPGPSKPPCARPPLC